MDQFKKTIEKTYGADGGKWLLNLPELVQKYLTLWKLVPQPEFEDLRFSYVIPAIGSDHKELVLKFSPHLKTLRREYEALKYFKNSNAVQVFDFSEQDSVLLLERILPGQSLKFHLEKKYFTDEQATFMAAKTIKELHSKKTNQTLDFKFSNITTWGLGFEKFLREDCRGVSFPRDQVLKADLIFKELVKTSLENIPLHGDLHHGNILLDENQNCRVIDPKGVFGDPAFEVGAFLRNPMSSILQSSNPQSLLKRRLEIFSEELQMPKIRVWKWAYCQCVLAAIWAVEDSTETWQDWMTVAGYFEQIQP